MKKTGVEVPRIEARYDSRKEWQADPKGYFLIKIFPQSEEIGARFCSYGKKPLIDIYGKDAESIVQTAVREGIVSTLQHAAYLGHELMRAEIALKLQIAYVQDKDLVIGKKKTKKS